MAASLWYQLLLHFGFFNNYLHSQCVYDVAPGGLLASVSHLMKIQYGVDQPE